jgi:uncharacterized protein
LRLALCVIATLTAALVVALSGTPASAAPAAPAGLTTSAVSFTGGGGVVLHGTVVAPAAAGGKRPGIVLVSGAGPQRGADDLPEAEAFARGGVVSLVYDKRTAGYSQFSRSYSLLADDALAAFQLLRDSPGVDPDRVGLWGESEGAWVVSLAAARSPQVAFLVTVGAVGVTPARQTAWNYVDDLRHAGVSGSLIPAMQQTATRLVVGIGLFPEADYDPIPAWEHVRQPVLALWGDEDQQVPVAESARNIQSALEHAGNQHYTIRFLPNAGHGLHVPENGGFEGGSLVTAPGVSAIAPGYPELVSSWIDGLAHGAPAATAQPTLHQASAAPPQSLPLAPLGWYESPWMQLGALTLFLLAFAAWPLASVLRRRPLAPLVRLPARALIVTGLVSVLGLPLYLLFMLETAASMPGPVLVGRPLPWLALQILAAVALAATIVTGATWWRARSHMREDRARLAVLLAAGVVYVLWAFYWGLLVP